MGQSKLTASLRLAAFSVFVLTVSVPRGVAADALVERGKYLAAIMDCTGCHTGGVLTGKPDPAR